MTAHSFTVRQMVALVRAGLATATAERMRAGKQEMEIARVTVIIGRRELLAALGGAAAAWPLAASAQQPAKPVVGSLYGVSAAEWASPMAGFRRGLSEWGFDEGRNVAIVPLE